MGFFSWKTADTEISIPNSATGLSHPVYLLQPDGKPSLFEPSYSGYGEFGGKDAHEWLAQNNLDPEFLKD